ncbi:MAG TPA: hypothetical protein VNN22_11750 [Verrucomicrobiae bacterium]|nr:hypothetical protein [Verrucomicrobiae bacterium]
MRAVIIIFCFVVCAFVAFAATHYLEPHGDLQLHIKSATSPIQKPESLQITLELSAIGQTPLALSQDQFAVEISAPRSFAVKSDAFFGTNAPHIFTVLPGETNTITLGMSTNGVVFADDWKTAKLGKCFVQVHVGSSKWRHFDYEFMAQRHSNRYEIELK